MRTANPALNDKTFQHIGTVATADAMTINGTVNKTGIMLLLLIASAAYTWSQFIEGNVESLSMWMLIGIIGGLLVAFVTVFKKIWAPVTAPLYAVLEGFALGGISAILEASYPGIVIQAVALTFGTAGCLLLAYKSGVIKATENFKLGVFAATGGIALIYLVGWIMSFFGSGIPYIHENGLIGIGFSLVVVVIAALNLVLDFDFIEKGAEHGAPKFMEWYAAFGLLVTLIWLYIEILRLLSKLNSRK
ncbi:MAG: Bax inhibitor-1/YccA family protein [Ignavibacteriales bacterium]|nr:Bax inhibitor-1/YccA family protein [Ignavibacteriales bacterium]